MTADIIHLSDFRQPLRSDRYRVTSATRGEVKERRMKEARTMRAAKWTRPLPSKDVLANYVRAIAERGIDPIFLTDDNGGAS